MEKVYCGCKPRSPYPRSPSASSVQAENLNKLYNYNMWYLYLLFCDKKTFYVGITDNLERRLKEHKNKESFFTKKFFNIEMVYCEEYKSKIEVAKREQQIKGWSRAKKQMLIDGNLGINTCTGLLKRFR